MQYRKFLALGRRCFCFHEKQILHLALQNRNYFVNYKIPSRRNISLRHTSIDVATQRCGQHLQVPTCIETDLFCSNSSSNNDVLSRYIRGMHLSCNRLILLFIIRLWNIQIRGQLLNCELKNEFISISFLDRLI